MHLSEVIDWEAAKFILDQRPELVRFGISENYDTPLHIAASAESTKLVENFVENLEDLMTKEELELHNKDYTTALCVAAAAGNVKVAMSMVNKHRALIDIPGNKQMMPLYMASLFGRSEMVKYLYGNSRKMTGDFWGNQNHGWVLQKCVEADLFVFGVFHVKVGHANKESDAMKLVRIIWTKIVTLSKVEIDGMQKYASQILFVAAKMGNTEFVVELICQYPDLIWKTNDKKQSIFHVAVRHRHEGIYNLLYEIGSMKDMIVSLKDIQGNNMLHLVGKCPKTNHISGVALLMQRELLWFMEVSNMLPPSYQEMKNNARKTPRNLFSMEHKQLLLEGERLMKETASQSKVVSALIATIAFAVAFTVPGGYNQDNGIPMFLDKRYFIVFVVADAISLILSSISILIFLSIHIASYSEHDFLDSLPKTLLNGLATLSLSIMAMMIAFSVSFFVLYHNNLIWVPIVVGVFASTPVIFLVKLQYRVLRDVFRSTYAPTNLFKPKKLRLYVQTPKF